jgi:hypothetical protein
MGNDLMLHLSSMKPKIAEFTFLTIDTCQSFSQLHSQRSAVTFKTRERACE